MLNKIKKAFSKDLWIVLLDIFAVNVSYFLALLIRFYVNFRFRPTVSYLLMDFYTFAPFYTAFCIIVFYCFHLYGGMWQYAGLDDMNRIIKANVITTLGHVLGTVFFIKRMPITYYVIGAFLQFVFIIAIRFSYKFFNLEKARIQNRNAPAINVMVVGLGEVGQKIINQVQANKALKAVCYVDSDISNDGRLFNGIPVVGGIDRIDSAISEYNVQSAFIADQQLTKQQRLDIQVICEKNKVEIHDYTGYLSNTDDAAALSGVLNAIKGPVTIVLYGEETNFDNGYQALKELTDSYSIQAISSKDDTTIIEIRSNQQIVFVLDGDKEEAFVGYDAWSQRHREAEAKENKH